MTLSGKKLNRWTILQDDLRKGSAKACLCRCECGTVKLVNRQSLLRKNPRYVSKSCGCYNSESLSKRNYKHGLSSERVYRSWQAMWARCTQRKAINWKYYGGKGITVCDRWKSFENFISDMGQQPTNKHSIDRIDSSGNYEPANCRWATALEQNDSSRKKRQ